MQSPEISRTKTNFNSNIILKILVEDFNLAKGATFPELISD